MQKKFIALTCLAATIANVSAKVIDIKSTSHLQEELKGANAVIKFSAEWCGPCKKLKPIYHDIANQEEFKSIKFLAVDVDPHGDIADRYGISGIPILVFVKNGKEIERQGSTSLEGLKITLRRAFDLTATVPAPKKNVEEEKLEKKVVEQKEQKTTEQPIEKTGIMHSIKKSFKTVKDAIVDGFNWIKNKITGSAS